MTSKLSAHRSTQISNNKSMLDENENNKDNNDDFINQIEKSHLLFSHLAKRNLD